MRKSILCLKIQILLFALVGLVAPVALADEVVLKNGSRFKGRVLLDQGGRVILKTSSGTITFRRSAIQSIVRGPVGRTSESDGRAGRVTGPRKTSARPRAPARSRSRTARQKNMNRRVSPARVGARAKGASRKPG